MTRQVDGDTIIDFALAFKDSKPPYEIEPPSLGGGVIDEPTPTNPAEIREGYSSCGATPPSTCHEEIFVYDDTEFDLRRRTEFKDLVDTNNVLAEDGKLGKDRHKLLPYRVYGYVLLSRKWCKSPHIILEHYNIDIPQIHWILTWSRT